MTSARALLAEAAARGVRVHLRHGELKAAYRGAPPRDLLDKLRAAKPEIIAEIAAESAPPPTQPASVVAMPPPPALTPEHLADARAAVDRLLDQMAHETARRREWWREPPEGWAKSRHWRDAVRRDKGMSANCQNQKRKAQ